MEHQQPITATTTQKRARSDDESSAVAPVRQCANGLEHEVSIMLLGN